MGQQASDPGKKPTLILYKMPVILKAVVHSLSVAATAPAPHHVSCVTSVLRTRAHQAEPSIFDPVASLVT